MRKIFVLVCMLVSIAVPCYAASVVTTIFPIYDWVREISAGVLNSSDITLLLDNGVDLHSYQPSVDDMVKISKADVFIYVGGESDEWVDDALKNVVNKNQVVINLLDVLGDKVKHEEIVEGREHDHDHEEEEADEHVWLSLRNAEIICRKICEVLAAKDHEHSEIYMSNTENYIRELSELDSLYETSIDKSVRKVLLFADRFPFRYMIDDYGLKYYAAFSGCSAESEASFETVIFLADKVNELGLPYMIMIDGTRHKIPETIIANTKAKNQRILTLDSMQSATMRDIQNGTTYLSVMRANLDTLNKALN